MKNPKTVLVLDAEADWYAEELGRTCPDHRFIAARDPDAALRHAEEAEILIGLAPALPRDLIGAMPRLEWVQALTTGVDNLLAMPQLAPGVTLSNCGGFHGPQMSELSLLMMLALNRDFPRMLANQADHRWERRPQPLLQDKTVAILGVGAIAEDLAVRCNAFGMTVTGVSDGRAAVPGFARIYKRRDLNEAAAQCDFLVVLVPLDASTRHIVDAGVLAAMKPDAFLINVSRGGCVDEDALLDALRDGRIAGAALDVFAQEPLDRDSPLWSAPRTLITPHIGGMADVYKHQALPIVAANLAAYAAGGAAALSGRIART